MTLFTDALRRIAEEGPPRVQAVDPFSDDERMLAERIMAATANVLPLPQDDRPADIGTENFAESDHLGGEGRGEGVNREIGLRSELTASFGVDLRHTRQLQGMEAADTLPSAGDGMAVEPPPAPETAVAPAAALCHQILSQFGSSLGGHVLAFVLVESAGGDAGELREILDRAARDLGGERPDSVLVIDTAADSKGPAVANRPKSSVQAAVRDVIHRPVALADLIANTDDKSVHIIQGPAPLGQSDQTLAQIVTFMDACRRGHSWTLVAAAATDLDELSAFLVRCDGVLVVVEAGRTERRAARQIAGRLRCCGANVCGGVLLERESTWRAAA